MQKAFKPCMANILFDIKNLKSFLPISKDQWHYFRRNKTFSLRILPRYHTYIFQLFKPCSGIKSLKTFEKIVYCSLTNPSNALCLKWKLTILNIMKLLLAFLMKMRYKTWLQFCPPINLYQKTLWILDMLCVFLFFFSRNYIWFGPYIFFHRLQNNPSCWQTKNTNDVRKVNQIWTCLSCNRSYEDQRTSENLIKCEPMPANF